MATPSKETIEILDNICTEIGAGKVLKLDGLTPEEQAHNNACERARTIVRNYREGYGLFQMMRDSKARRAEKADQKETKNEHAK